MAIQYLYRLTIGLIAIKINIVNFGQEVYGFWLLLLSIWGLGSAIDFGFGTSLIKFVAENKKNNSKVNGILSSAFVLFLLLGFVILVLGIMLSKLLYQSDAFHFANQSSSFLLIVFTLSISFYFQYISLFFKSFFEGLNQFSVTSKITILQNTVQIFGVILLYIIKLEINFLAYLYLMNNLLILIIYIIIFRWKSNNYKISLENISINQVKEIFSFSMSVQLISIFQSLIDPAIKYIISKYFVVESISAYEVARKISQSFSGLFFNTYKFILPEVSGIKLNFKEYIQSNLLGYSRIGLIFSGFMFGFVLFPIILLLDLFFDLEYLTGFILILSLPEIINNIGYPLYNFFLGIGRVHLLAFYQFLNLILMIFISILGFIWFHNIIGLVGYFVSVLVINYSMFLILHYSFKIDILMIFKNIPFLKIIVIIFFNLFLAFDNIFYGNYTLYYLVGSSIISLLIFFRDIRGIYLNNIILIK